MATFPFTHLMNEERVYTVGHHSGWEYIIIDHHACERAAQLLPSQLDTRHSLHTGLVSNTFVVLPLFGPLTGVIIRRE